ncbi:MAG: hypothetical protein R3F31_23270 [Verrucomicrobiales bacterium]
MRYLHEHDQRSHPAAHARAAESERLAQRARGADELWTWRDDDAAMFILVTKPGSKAT